MRNGIPVDDRQMEPALCVTAPEAKTDFDTGAVVVDKRTGLRVWQVGVAVRKVGDRKASVIDVKVLGDEAPAVKAGDTVRLVDLEASMWEQNGRAGMSYRASAVLPATSATSAPSAPSAPTAPSVATGNGTTTPATPPTPAAPAVSGGARPAGAKSGGE